VQSACFTFLRRVRGGEFQLEDSEGLWRLLCAITLAKVHKQTRFHLRQKRGLGQEVGSPAEDENASWQDPPAHEPAPTRPSPSPTSSSGCSPCSTRRSGKWWT
jgi:hypothetical protein